LVALLALVVVLLASPAAAHDFRPALLQLRELGPGQFELRLISPSSSRPRRSSSRRIVPGISARARSRSAAVLAVLQAEAPKPSLKRPSEVS